MSFKQLFFFLLENITLGSVKNWKDSSEMVNIMCVWVRGIYLCMYKSIYIRLEGKGVPIKFTLIIIIFYHALKKIKLKKM